VVDPLLQHNGDLATMKLIPPDEPFFQSLREFDRENFLLAKSKGCSHCQGPLDTANYPRKTRGMGEGDETRFSLCCRREGCRRRVTPPSLRFLGRKVFSAWIVILAVEYFRELGLARQIARQTVARWKKFWRDHLAETRPFIRRARSFLPPDTPSTESPSTLLKYFGFPIRESWIPTLKFFTDAASD